MPPNPGRIIDLANAFHGSCVLFTASDLGVFGLLARAGRSSSDAVAAALGLDRRAARLLLDGCVASGLLAQEDGGYVNTPEAAAFLAPGSPGDLSGAIRYNRDVYGAWGRLGQLIRSGAPVERPELHLGADASRTRTFVLSMHGRALGIGRAVIPLLRLEGRKRLLDIGGGPGTYSVLIAQANPAIRCTVLELPAVAAIAAELIAQQGMADRVTTLAGSYHTTPLPAGNDAVIVFGVLHQEKPDAIRELLRRAGEALEPGGVIYVMDMMTDETRAAPAFSALFALNMALTTENGWVFSDADLRGWLEDAGFAGFSVQPLPPPMPHWLARAVKP